jgi:transketolase
MRTRFIKTVTEIFERDDKAVLLLGDIGVHGFSSLSEKYPDRVINIGICEQATLGIASGMAKEGLHPIFYTIAPFATERCLEQIKIDIGYQNLPVTIVSVGGSYDYSALGCTHHCPADIALMKTIPNMNIFTPAYKDDVDSILKGYHGKEPVYMRIPDKAHDSYIHPIDYCNKNLVLAFGDTISNAIMACKYLDVDIVHAWVASRPVILEKCKREKIAVIEPWYIGTMQYDVQEQYPDSKILSIGVPRKFITTYGTKEDHDKECGLDAESLKIRLTEFFNGK